MADDDILSSEKTEKCVVVSLQINVFLVLDDHAENIYD